MDKRKITKKEFAAAVALCLVLLILVTVCILWQEDEEIEVHTEESYSWFDTYSVIRDYSGRSRAEFDTNFNKISARFDYYHKLFDIYNEYEDVVSLCEVNRLAKDGPVTVSPELIEFIEYAKDIYALTGGEVNIAMGAVLSIWHKYREEGVSVPSEALLSEAAEHCDITKIKIDKENHTVEFLDDKMSLDVGAIAKGYATECVADMLVADGISGYVLDIGGNIRAVGTKANGDSWRAGVKNPDMSGEPYIYYFDIADSSAVTSGNYERYYTVSGVNYHHIIDKDTLMPADHFSSVTVLTEDSALADSLSTALFNMTMEEGEALISTLDDVFVIWVTSDGSIITSENQKI